MVDVHTRAAAGTRVCVCVCHNSLTELHVDSRGNVVVADTAS